jgi:hypothetical protein
MTLLVRLNFRMADFRKDKDRSKVSLKRPKIFPGLQPQTVTRLGGPKIFVDLDEILVFAYFPYYVGKGAQVSTFLPTRTYE